MLAFSFARPPPTKNGSILILLIEYLRNLLLEKMQEIAEMKNNDVKKLLDGYKKELHTIYGGLLDD